MKKFVTLLLVLCVIFALASCGKCTEHVDENRDLICDNCEAELECTEHVDEDNDYVCDLCEGEITVALMSYAEYVAAAVNDKVVIESYVQATQSWWDNKITVYLQSEDGAYFVYEMACSEADAAKLEVGTKIKVTGFKSEWAGEVEIVDATFEIIEDDTFVAEATDVTALLGTDDLIKKQNMLVSFKGMTVKEISYKNDEPGDDIYVTLTKDGADYDFCVERYLTAPDTDVYKAVQALEVGEIVDIEGFLYWYNDMNPHITDVLTVMSYAEYDAAALDSKVMIESYVQATQSWWDNKITVYLQSEDGAYFAYEMACSEADAAKLTAGTKLRIRGYKGAWAGEVEIMDGTFEILEGTYVATATDVTALLGTDDLIKKQNMFVAFKGMTVKEISYKNDEPGDDIYVTLTKDGADYDFCVERYLTAPDTDVYKAVGELVAGDVIDVEGFLYWYNGMNPHITKVTKQ